MKIPEILSPVKTMIPDQVKDLLRKTGIVLLRNSENTKENFLEFSNGLGENFVRYSRNENQEGTRVIGGNNGRNVIDGNKTLFSTTGKGYAHEVPVHGELYFQSRNPPGHLWFYCQKAAQTKGETIFCDGISLYKSLPEGYQHLLKEKGLIYERHHDKATWQMLYRVDNFDQLRDFCGKEEIGVRLNPDESVTTRFKSKSVFAHKGEPVFINNFLPFALRQLYKPEETRAKVLFGDGSEITEDLVSILSKKADELSEYHKWKNGDIVVIQNTRILHGRNELDMSEREVFVRMSS